MTSRRIRFALIFIPLFLLFLYVGLWGFDWMLTYFPDYKLQRVFIWFSIKQSIGFQLTPDALEFLRALAWHRRDIADGLIWRAVFSLSGALIIACLIAFSGRKSGKKDEEFVRGSSLVDEKKLRNRLERGEK